MTKPSITPALNNQVQNRASQLCTEQNDFTRKAFNKNYDIAIKEIGYTPAYFKSKMRMFGSMAD